MTASSPKAAVSNGHSVGWYEQGMCQKFVRDQCWRVPSLYGSAIEAWNGARYKHPGDRTPPIGAPVYYRGGSYGHAVIFCGQGHDGIRSTDCTTATKVSDTDLAWPERAWGYVYLGWTEDINGVHVITGDTGDNSGGGDDDMELNDSIAEWSPDDGGTGDTTVGKTLNQARGYSEDTYERVKKLENKVAELTKTVNAIAKNLGV